MNFYILLQNWDILLFSCKQLSVYTLKKQQLLPQKQMDVPTFVIKYTDLFYEHRQMSVVFSCNDADVLTDSSVGRTELKLPELFLKYDSDKTYLIIFVQTCHNWENSF